MSETQIFALPKDEEWLDDPTFLRQADFPGRIAQHADIARDDFLRDEENDEAYQEFMDERQLFV